MFVRMQAKGKGKRQLPDDGKGNGKKRVKCFGCQKYGHIEANCPEKRAKEQPAAASTAPR